ncbi:MAG TPA: glycosyltransferase family 2 protein [Bryobacteraceae bacterium]|nr:glycosyltransferase family 2 protein [Bryobacteraceae bacterium]
MAAAICWACGLFVFYVLAGYPLCLAVLARLRPRPWQRRFVPMPVTVLMPVRNGERWLRDKLESLLALDYPADLLRILVLSDGSTDATAAIARSYAGRGVECQELPPGGKGAALNAGLASVQEGALLMTDVRQQLSRNSLRDLVACLGDPAVGVASGELILRDGASGETRNVGLYWKYEKFIRRRQALLGSVPGATGAIYVIRRELARPLPPDILLDDVFLPVGAIRQGYRVVFEDRAIAYDDAATLDAEFGRKVRTQGGVWQLLRLEPWLLSPANPIWLHVLSHKAGRLLLPFALLAFLLASPWTPAPWPALLLGGQGLFYGLAFLDSLLREGSPLKRATGPLRTFVTLLLAAAAGIRVFWTPARDLWRPPASRL